MLSGIGNRDHLAEHGIDVLHHSPEVGENMLDDLACPLGYDVRNDSLFDATVNLRSCGRSVNHISLIRHTRPGESRRRTGENRPRIAQVDSAHWNLIGQATATGFDVGRFGAVAERDRHRCPVVGQWVGEQARVALGVHGQGSDGADGLLLAFVGDRVVAERGLD